MEDTANHTAEIHNLPVRQLSRSVDLSPQTLNARLVPAPVSETVAMLTACLSLVKPVGMSAEDAQAWLRVAARELSDLPPDLLAHGCTEARRTCTHHGQIVPTIIKVTGETMAIRRDMANRANRKVELPKPGQGERWTPQPGELEAIKREVAEKLRVKS